MGTYSKLWVMLAGAVFTLASRWIPGLEGADAEMFVEGTILALTAVGVYGVRNKPLAK